MEMEVACVASRQKPLIAGVRLYFSSSNSAIVKAYVDMEGQY